MFSNMLLDAAAQGQEGGGGISGIIMIVAMIVIFYFFMIRPQSKKQKELKKAREAMKSGSHVVTAGGIHGTIREINESTAILKIAEGVAIKVDTASIYPYQPVQPKNNAKQSAKNESAEK